MARKHQKSKKKKNFRVIPRSLPLAILMIVLLAVEALFIPLVGVVDLLPGKYLMAALGVLLLLDILVIWLLNDRSGKKRKKVTGIIIGSIMILVLGVGGYYLINTLDTLSKIGNVLQSEKYQVIVLKNGSYEDVEDITGKRVYTVDNNSKMYKEAKGKLKTAADVTYEDKADVIAVGEQLITSKGTEQDNIIFLSESRYRIVCDEIDGFEENTKVIYTIKIPMKTNNNASNVDVTEDPFNVYISGSDARGDIDEVARSDVNMIVTVNPQTHTILLTSMPRDSYVPLHMNGKYDKLTHTGVYGIDETLDTVEDWLGVESDFYCRVGFNMLVELVNAVGGVTVHNEQEFHSHPKGWYYREGDLWLNGRRALWFARERKSFEDEDEQRIKNQQKVMKALIEKVTSSKTLVLNYTQILNSIEDYMQTDLSRKNISKLAKMQLDTMPKWKIITQTIDGEPTERGTYSMGFERMLFVSIPDEESVEKAKQKIQEVMYPVDKKEDNKKNGQQ